MENKYLEKIASIKKSAGIAGMLGATAKTMLGLGSKAVKGMGNYASDAIGRGYMANAARATGIKDTSKLVGLGGQNFGSRRRLLEQVAKNKGWSKGMGRQGIRNASSMVRGIPTNNIRPVLPNISTSGSNVASAWKGINKKKLGPEVFGSSKGMNKGVMPDLKNKLITGRLVTGGAAVGAGVLAHKVSNKVSGNNQPQYYN